MELFSNQSQALTSPKNIGQVVGLRITIPLTFTAVARNATTILAHTRAELSSGIN